MEWWSAILGVGGLAVVAIALRSPLLSFVTLAFFLPLVLHTLYHDFSRFWILVVLTFVIEVAALIRQTMGMMVREPVVVQTGRAIRSDHTMTSASALARS